MSLPALATAVASFYMVMLALLLGSFINLAADRLPRGESVVRPRSHCRGCGRQLNIVDLIPVGGYVLRQGRCAGCGVAIGRSSLAVEAFCGLAMTAALVLLGPVEGAVVGLGLVAVAGAVTVGLSYARPRPR